MSRLLSTRNISSKSMHAFLSNLANRQTNERTRANAFTSSFVVGISNNITESADQMNGDHRTQTFYKNTEKAQEIRAGFIVQANLHPSAATWKLFTYKELHRCIGALREGRVATCIQTSTVDSRFNQRVALRRRDNAPARTHATRLQQLRQRRWNASVR